MRLMVWVSAIWVAIAFSAWAGPEKISFPEGYQSHFVRYVTMDKPKLKAVRFLCVNPESLQTAEPNRPAPYGTVIVMQDNKAKLGPDGAAFSDSELRPESPARWVLIEPLDSQGRWRLTTSLQHHHGCLPAHCKE